MANPTVPQTQVTLDCYQPLEGQLQSVGSHHAVTRASEGDVSFGRLIIQGTAENQCKVADVGSGKVLGISIHSHVYDRTADAGATDGSVAAGHSISILDSGDITVYPETPVAVGDDVYYRFQNASGGSEAVGRFRNDDDGAPADVAQLTSGFRWVRGTTVAGGPATLRVKL